MEGVAIEAAGLMLHTSFMLMGNASLHQSSVIRQVLLKQFKCSLKKGNEG